MALSVGTSGGWSGTGGGRRVWLIGCAVLVGFVLLETAVTSTSIVAERVRDGEAPRAWTAWTLEGSSAIGWFIAMPLIALAALRLRPPRLSWPLTLLTHAALTLPVSLLHVGVMVPIRAGIFALMGEAYRLADDVPAALLYEWRKDAADYIAIALLFAVIGEAARRAEGGAPATTTPARIEVRDGTRTYWLDPAEILWAQAAGNYVELHAAGRDILHRATLADLERTLAPHGFARIHRSRLVRLAAVRAIQTNASGDFEVEIEGGSRLTGSRRFRAALDAA